ncbi:MAG: RluA family pseudouridine synthase [Planctomycetota bacterium]|nr:MAG: RluA family pseudouridine synthase [Planctomycetota bacterium]
MAVAFTLSRDLRKRLDLYLTDRVPFLSRAQAQRLIDAGAVTVNDRPRKASTTLRAGDTVRVALPPVAPERIEPQEMPLDVLYEDERLIVLNKQPGVIVHPARRHRDGTLLNGLAWHFRHASRVGGTLSPLGADDARPGVVHRLDRDTTGVIVFAKDEEAHWRLGRQFETRRVEKRYLALVLGVPDPPAGVIDLPLGPHPSRAKGHREKQVVRHDTFGKPSVTLYRTLERFDGFALVELELRTGRTHQIRVHLAHEGWPIVGDDMYGGPILTGADLGADPPGRTLMGRQALHAALLEFAHPATGEPLRFTAPVPDDVRALVSLLRSYRPGSGPVKVKGARVDPAALGL